MQNNMTSTYDPADNKCRLRSAARLPKDLYERVRGAGFIWAPKQELFVAPMWTPGREDLLLELCGEIGDEDTSLVDRAEERAERFTEYKEHRAEDAAQARAGVSAIADNIPFGQPILIGHHSERHAIKDAERIESGMRKAVKMWETSEYWKQRAAGAIAHAKYKELPAVRARRIKGIEADKRKQERNKAEAERALRFWRGEMVFVNRTTGEKYKLAINEENRARIRDFCGGGLDVGGFNVAPKEGGASWEGWSAWNVLDPDDTRYKACPSCTVEQCREAAERVFTSKIAHYNRWITHYEHRLEYERAMLAESGGMATDKTGPEKGGACHCWASPRGGFSYIQKVNKVSVTVLDNWGNGGKNFTRTIPFDQLSAVMTAAQVGAARANGALLESPDKTGFYIRGEVDAAQVNETPEQRNERLHKEHMAAKAEKESTAAPFGAMRETLKAGIRVVSAPQLFPTPPDLCKRMVDAAGVLAGRRVLEPSAGTGNIIRTAINSATGADCMRLVAVEINPQLAEGLRNQRDKTLYANESNFDVRCADFLQCNSDLGLFDVVLMNPPFSNGADIKHIEHARHFLKPGGKIVAICANGPRQREALQPIATDWVDLPAGSFAESGTSVNAAMLVIEV